MPLSCWVLLLPLAAVAAVPLLFIPCCKAMRLAVSAATHATVSLPLLNRQYYACRYCQQGPLTGWQQGALPPVHRVLWLPGRAPPPWCRAPASSTVYCSDHTHDMTDCCHKRSKCCSSCALHEMKDAAAKPMAAVAAVKAAVAGGAAGAATLGCCCSP